MLKRRVVQAFAIFFLVICCFSFKLYIHADPNPLENLQPTSRLLSADTTSVTLSLTTQVNANCRWSETPSTAYANMPNNFSTGQGTTSHSTAIGNWTTVTKRTFYVRCADINPGRDPDGYELSTSLRKMGAFDSGYPKILSHAGQWSASNDADYFAGLNVWMSWWSNATYQSRANAVRAINPKTKMIMTQDASYGVNGHEWDTVYTAWLNAAPGSEDYHCMFRNTAGTILTNGTYGNPMYNLTYPYCVTTLVNQNVNYWNSTNLAYDGIFWDMMGTTITNTLTDPTIDGDLNGVADNPATLNAAYKAGMESFLTQIRAAIPNAILIGNDSPSSYGEWENGAYFETGVRNYLDDYYPDKWEDIVDDYRNWIVAGQTEPVTVTLMTTATDFLPQKYGPQIPNMPTAMKTEAGQEYRRVRFGLATALMGDGLALYDMGPFYYGFDWWYDEYGTQNDYTTTGYLGQPTAAGTRVEDTLSTTDDITNGGFSSGTSNWTLSTSGGDVSASWVVDPTGGPNNSACAHITIPSGNPTGSGKYILFYQDNLTVEEGKYYTLSFWAKANAARMNRDIRIQRQVNPWEYDATAESNKYNDVDLTTSWKKYYVTMKATVTNNNQGRLIIGIATTAGQIYFDDIKVQEGTIGVWTRPFDNGRVFVNTTPEVKTVDLIAKYGVSYTKLNGTQAPLYYTRIDDDDTTTVVSGAWTNTTSTSSSYPNQFGDTFKTITGSNPAATVTYNPSIAYNGDYIVYAWVAPSGSNRANVSVTINHGGSTDTTTLNETTGSIGWHSLGTYSFTTTDTASVVISGTGSTGTVVADAIKLETTARYNDGSQADTITLQPDDAIILMNDETPPMLSSISISDTSGFTNDATPDITIVSSNSPLEVAFSCNGGTNWSSWITYADTISSFNITSGATGCSAINGSKTITAKLRDLSNNESTTVSDTTYYDTTGPTGSISNGSGNPTNDTTPTLNLTIVDSGVGISGAQVRFSCDNATWSSWGAYATPKSDFNIKPGVAAYGCGTTDGMRTVYMQYRDSLQNVGFSYTTGAFNLDTAGPTVTINQAVGQADPTDDTPIVFTVSFNESVSDFATGDVTLSGTAGATTGVVSGSGTTYTVDVLGMIDTGTVIATLSSGVAHDAAGNGNSVSTSTDNSVTYTIVPCIVPGSGDWTITESCSLTSNATAPAHVIVEDTAILEILDGVTLNIDLQQYYLLIDPLGTVIIKPTGKIE